MIAPLSAEDRFLLSLLPASHDQPARESIRLAILNGWQQYLAKHPSLARLDGPTTTALFLAYATGFGDGGLYEVVAAIADRAEQEGHAP